MENNSYTNHSGGVGTTPPDTSATENKYNAYRNDISAEEAVRKKYPLSFRGDAPLENEPLACFFSRRVDETYLIRNESKKMLRKSANRMGLLLLLYIVISTVLQTSLEIISSYINADFFFNTGIGYTLFIAVAYILIYPVTFPIAIGIGDIGEPRTLRSYLRAPACSAGYMLKSCVVAVGVAYIASIAVNILTALFTAFTGIEIYDPGMSGTFTSVWDAVVYFFALCVFPPVFEELLFRGTMLSHHLKFGGWHAAIVTSVMFGLFHQNLQQFIYTTVTGIVFSVVVIKTGSLLSSMILHFVFNFLAYMQMFSGYLIDNYDELISGEATIAEGSPFAVVLFSFFTYLPYLIIIAAVIILIVDLNKDKSAFYLPKGDSRLTESEKCACFFSAPAVIAACALIGIGIAFVAFVYPILLQV